MLSMKKVHSFHFIIVCLLFENVMTNDEQPAIISISKNITVEQNDTVHLPCLVAQMENTIAIWQQCDDPMCNELLNPITIGKENFIQDLRFRLLFNDNVGHNNSWTWTDRSDKKVANWMLEIRRFSKADEACYECQLNTVKANKIHYCLKLKPKLFISSKKLTLESDETLKLECHVNSNVQLNRIKWYKNNVKLHDNHRHHNHYSTSYSDTNINNNNTSIDRIHFNGHSYAILTIRNIDITYSGLYTCKYDNSINETADVFIKAHSFQSNLIVDAESLETLLSNTKSIAQSVYFMVELFVIYFLILSS